MNVIKNATIESPQPRLVWAGHSCWEALPEYRTSTDIYHRKL